MKHYIIPVFIPHLGCPHQCIFCNQNKITGRQTPVTAEQVAAIIEERLAAITQNRRIEVAFYGGSFTALPEDIQNELLTPATQALRSGRIHAIRLSTRPDCITGPIVDNLTKQEVNIVELGVQSLDDNVLGRSARGHNSQAVADAVRLLKMAGISCGLQLMPGLPGEDWLSLIGTVRQAILLKPDFVRIYPAVVITGTVLAELYSRGDYCPLSLAQAVARSAYMKLVFERQGIAVIRTGLQASEELDSGENVLAGPYHPAFGELVDSHIFYLMMTTFIEQAALHHTTCLFIRHHPQDCSKVRGQHNINLSRLKHRYSLLTVNLHADSAVTRSSLVLEYQGSRYILNKNMIKSI
ncbi:elongator complex protein 3 [Sporomusa carbonis]|uniref:elongator complex protein 3 n=1 Tax=Sporomusa carbonis TaxID=3076075 RepID=UPI003C7DC409